MKSYKHLSFITAVFASILLISNTVGSKIFFAGSLPVPASLICVPIICIFGDVLTEVYGYNVTRKVIWTGFFCELLMVLFYTLAVALPPAPFWPNQPGYASTLGGVPRLVLASITAYFAGEFCNSYILAKLKLRTAGRGVAWRFVLSTAIGQALDTSLFVSIAFYGTMPLPALITAGLTTWAIKIAWEVITLPITLPAVRWLKRVEHEDYYDRETNFNPFHLQA
jgi:uncharacterized integral membrane protein (TIGR00697 family)